MVWLAVSQYRQLRLEMRVRRDQPLPSYFSLWIAPWWVSLANVLWWSFHFQLEQREQFCSKSLVLFARKNWDLLQEWVEGSSALLHEFNKIGIAGVGCCYFLDACFLVICSLHWCSLELNLFTLSSCCCFSWQPRRLKLTVFSHAVAQLLAAEPKR